MVSIYYVKYLRSPAERKIHFAWQKVIKLEITYKLDLNHVHYAEQGKRTYVGRGHGGEILGRRNCVKRGANKGMICSEVAIPQRGFREKRGYEIKGAGRLRSELYTMVKSLDLSKSPWKTIEFLIREKDMTYF